MVLGSTRRVFDNTFPLGLSKLPTSAIPVFIFEMLKGTNLQAALTTIFARMLSIDILYVHLFYIPVLWGVFVPIASFLTTKAIGGSEKVSVLSSLLVSAFPYTIYFGAISVPNSLGFIFSFYSLYFMLKYLSSNDSKTAYCIAVFSFFSFLSHYLTGVMSFSLLLLALSFKAYASEKGSSVTAKISLMVSFLFSASLLPISFIYLGFFGPYAKSVFTLDKLYELPLEEIVGLSLLGELIYSFDLKTIFLLTVGPVLAFLYMIYQLYSLKRNPTAKLRANVYFLFAAFLIVLIDYRILKLFMSGLPLNEERLWVFQDFIAAQFAILAIYAVFVSLETFLKAKYLPFKTLVSLKTLSKGNVLCVLSLLLASNILIPALLGGWITFSLSVAYPQVAPLQTTWYELKTVKYIDENTAEKYVVIGDVWTVFAGERFVGIHNPRAYYFGEYDKTGYDLFFNMTQNPSPQWMLLAMNYSNTTVAYFIVTQSRLGAEGFQNVVARAIQNKQLSVVIVPQVPFEKLYVFSYRKG